MKVIIYDHLISFKRGGRYLEMYSSNITPFEIKGGDTVRVDHKAEVSLWEIVKSILTQKPLLIYSSKNEIEAMKGGEQNGRKSSTGPESTG